MWDLTKSAVQICASFLNDKMLPKSEKFLNLSNQFFLNSH